MKKLLLVFVLGLYSTYMYAQGGVNFGVKGGYGIAYLNNSNWLNDGDIKPYPVGGWTIGGSLGYNAMYLTLGYTVGFFWTEFNQRFEDKTQPTFINLYHEDIKTSYLSIPVMIRFRPGSTGYGGEFTLGGGYFEMGVVPSFLARGTYSHIDTVPTLSFDKVNIAERYNNFNLLAMIGFGFHQFGTENWSVTHGLRLSYGLIDLTNGTQDLMDRNYTTYKPTSAMRISYILGIVYKVSNSGIIYN
ncbi:MAG: outer membrane beta-barrel protein [Bacteroidetes bacterium]|nr:outer membrane beta-barrel protein [Bacteroidota bacterium]